ncbi:hypothetical protein HOY80DRAFT_983843 [Tuber brumale]|nr:hypothetical protein HOY80DRAFT_983843 [Tuber brumale]
MAVPVSAGYLLFLCFPIFPFPLLLAFSFGVSVGLCPLVAFLLLSFIVDRRCFIDWRGPASSGVSNPYLEFLFPA